MGGQFAPAPGGQFAPARGGQFSPASGGQFDRFLQVIRQVSTVLISVMGSFLEELPFIIFLITIQERILWRQGWRLKLVDPPLALG